MDNFEIRFGGTGGQGLQLSAKLLADALSIQGLNVARSQSYEPTSRGGISRADLVVSEDNIDFPLLSELDLLILLDQPALGISLPLMKKGGVVLADDRRTQDIPTKDLKVHVLPLSEMALAMGNERVTNIIALGAFAGINDLCDYDILEQTISKGVPPRFLELNLSAFAKGYELTAGSAAKVAAG
ncbi:MAG: pyruvate ferredoxin oxidoreductase [Rhodospirillales bacterium]|jgi:2-oxoglutarate ferredoxin oxidoreductase subunit gamma|nr:pyruvate ferredoxin oxidoreductase [Rhodospirillales bacterium]